MNLRRDRLLSLGLSGQAPSLWTGLLASFAVVVGGTLLVFPLKSLAPVVSLAVVYLPAIMVISIIWGWRLGLLTSFGSALAFNFFQLPPVHRLTLADDRNWVALATFAITATLSSAVASLARARAIEVEERRQETSRALAELEALSRERDRMQEEMVEAEAYRRSDELKTALLRSISHDLRTPTATRWSGCSKRRDLTASSSPQRPTRRSASAATIWSGYWRRRPRR